MKLTKILMAAAAVVLMASCCGKKAQDDCCGGCKTMPIGLQLYSVRGDMQQNFKGTLQKVKDMGYDGVEFAGLYGNTPEQINAWCKEIGLNPISAHVSLTELLADTDKVIADYKAIGCQYIAVPHVGRERRPGGDKFEQMIEELRLIGQKCQAAGITLLYHNHDFEFAKTESGEFGLDYLYANVPTELLQTELDLCWVRYAGQEPIEYLRKYAGRAPVVHLKDYYKEGEMTEDPYALIGVNEGEEKKSTAFEFRPIGCGVQDIPAIIKASVKADSKWLIVEQDQPSLGKSAMECAAMSIEYIKRLQAEGCCDGGDHCGDCSEESCSDCGDCGDSSCNDCSDNKCKEEACKESACDNNTCKENTCKENACKEEPCKDNACKDNTCGESKCGSCKK